MALTLLPAPQVIAQTDLARQLDAALTPPKVRTTIAACVIDLASGRVLYERDADRPMIPASNMKLLTTALALDLFGAEHKMRTRLALKGDTLALVGAGDPGLGDPRIAELAGMQITEAFTAWARALAEAGAAQRVRNVVYDDSIFDDQWRHPNWNQNEFSSWYAAPIGGLSFNDNCVDITVEPTASRPAVLLTPPCGVFEIDNQLTPGGGNAPRAGRVVGGWQLRLTGPVSQRTFLGSVAVYDPGEFTAAVLHDVLQKTFGSQLAAPRRTRVTDQSGNLLEGWQVVGIAETPLYALLQRANTHSQNMFAESLLKLAGAAATGGPGSWASGRVAAMQFLRRHDLPTEGVVIDDGSGLSRENRLTARLLARLLATMHAREDWPVWQSSLAVGGESGTLAQRFRRDLRSKVYAKTGYISGVSSLSGYIQTRGGRWLAFSFLYNGSTSGAKQAQEKACEVLYDRAGNAPSLQAAGR